MADPPPGWMDTLVTQIQLAVDPNSQICFCRAPPQPPVPQSAHILTAVWPLLGTYCNILNCYLYDCGEVSYKKHVCKSLKKKSYSSVFLEYRIISFSSMRFWFASFYFLSLQETIGFFIVFTTNSVFTKFLSKISVKNTWIKQKRVHPTPHLKKIRFAVIKFQLYVKFGTYSLWQPVEEA